MNNVIYRVFLYSSDVDRLTHEADFTSKVEAHKCVIDWCNDKDPEAEFERGHWEIQHRLNGHLRGTYSARATAYPLESRKELNKALEHIDGEEVEAYQKRITEHQMSRQKERKEIISRSNFNRADEAALAMDKAIDKFALDLDPLLYWKIQRENRAKGVHQRFMTDLTPFGYEVFCDERQSNFSLAEDTTIEELKAIRFQEESVRSVSPVKVFNVESGALRVTDPCYSMDTWCAGTLENVLNGRWFANVGFIKEGVEKYTLKRFKEEIKELDDPETAKTLDSMREVMNTLPEGSKEEHQETIDSLEKFYQSQALREFSRSWGNPDDWTGRVAYLHIRHESAKRTVGIKDFEAVEGLDVGVDSGQAGLFDLDAFVKVAATELHENDSTAHEGFYEACGKHTLSSRQWGIVQGMGVVSSSGYGDGGYPLYVKRNEEGKVVEARIVYIEENEPEYGEEE